MRKPRKRGIILDGIITIRYRLRDTINNKAKTDMIVMGNFNILCVRYNRGPSRARLRAKDEAEANITFK